VVLRYDIGALRKPVKRADGTIKVDGYLTRTGIFEYRNPDGSVRREYRPDAEVFKLDSLESFQMVPLTNDHPPEMLTAANAKQYAVGAVGESVRKDGDKVAASIVVYDAVTVAKLERGKVQLSCGYECDLDPTPGEINGSRYDAIQRNIRGNHVALVDVGRAGPDVRIRMDAGIMVIDECDDLIVDKPENPVEPKLIETLEKLAAEKTRADEAVALAASEKARADAEAARADGLKAEASNAEKARKDAEDTFNQRVLDRVALVSKATAILGAEANVNELNDRAIKVAVVKKVDSEDLGVDKSDAYVDGRFDSAAARCVKADAALAEVRQSVQDSSDAGADAEAAARAKMIERNRNAWKGSK
jgi:uncharacterized protein